MSRDHNTMGRCGACGALAVTKLCSNCIGNLLDESNDRPDDAELMTGSTTMWGDTKRNRCGGKPRKKK